MPVKPPPRQIALLAALVVVLAAVLVYEFWGSAPPGRTGAPAAPTTGGIRASAERDRLESAPDVRLPALEAVRPEPSAKGRNLFRELPKAPPPPPRPVVPVQPAPDPNAPPPPPPPPPPITLKLFAIVEGSGRPIAALTDGRDVFYGREGDSIEGRYRINKIGVESVDVSYLDGRGQQRLRLAK